jgi:hypothetical protein
MGANGNVDDLYEKMLRNRIDGVKTDEQKYGVYKGRK